MYGRSGNDNFYGEEGNDYFNSGEGNDRIAVQDGVFDRVDCGPGDYDAVEVDLRLVSYRRNCENVYWQ